MPLFSKSKTTRDSLPLQEPSWEDWKEWQNQHRQPPTSGGASTPRPSRTDGPPPRSILRSNHASLSDPAQSKPTARASVPNLPSTPNDSSANDGRSRFLSLPESSSLGSFGDRQLKPDRSIERDLLKTSLSLSQINARSRAAGVPRCSDAEADRVARACGDGPFSPNAPSPFLETSAFMNTSPRHRSQSMSNPRDCQGSPASPDTRRSVQRAQPFPHPSKPQAIKALKQILAEETKAYKIHDYIEVEELLSGQLWDDEVELLVDCVRDKADEDSGHDGVWRRERRERRFMERVNREIRQRDGSVFGSYIQDLPESSMVPVIMGGYRHHVPEVVHACTDELYKTGIYHHDLFRTMPNRNRLFQLVTYFDNPHQYAQLSSRSSVPNLPSSSSFVKPRLSLHRESYSEICALLVTYLTSLPTPLVHRSLVDALWAWCVSPSIIRAEQRLRRHGDDDASESSSSDSDEDEDTPNYSARLRKREEVLLNLPPLRVQINIARQVLLLLPRRHFSMVVCLLTFFATLQVCPDNGLAPEDVGRIFGGAIVGGRSRKDAGARDESESETSSRGRSMSIDGKGIEQPKERSVVRAMREKDEKGPKIIAWLVQHWEDISSAYEADDEDHSGRRSNRMVPLSRNGTQEEVPRARSKSCSVADPSCARDPHASSPPQGKGVPQRPRQSEGDFHSNRLRVGPRRDRDDQSPRPGMKHRQAFADRSCEKKRRMSAPVRPLAQSTESSESDDYGIPASPLNPRSVPKQLRPSAISVRAREPLPLHRSAGLGLDLDSPVPPRIELPKDVMNDKLFKTPAPFDLNVDDADDDVSIYSTDTSDDIYDMYSSSLLQDPLPDPHHSLSAAASPSVPPLHWSKRSGEPDLDTDAFAASRFVLERENADLRRRLEEALGERDEARKVLDAMQGLIGRR